jgi:hypothetical protein
MGIDHYLNLTMFQIILIIFPNIVKFQHRTDYFWKLSYLLGSTMEPNNGPKHQN